MSLEPLKPIFEKKTEVQTIRLYEYEPDNSIIFTLDTYVQFKEGIDEEIYHKTLVNKAIDKANNPKKFLICGGGDGLAARNILDSIINPEIYLIDFDKEVTDLFRTNKRLLTINKGSLEYCKVFNQDIKKWIEEVDIEFDIIIYDMPDNNSEELGKLYIEETFVKILNRLKKEGIFSIQVNPSIVKEISDILNKYLQIEVIDYSMPWHGEGNIIIGRKC